MPRSKHTPEFRARVSQEYIDGTGSVIKRTELILKNSK